MFWKFRQILGEFIKDPRRDLVAKNMPLHDGPDLKGDRDVEWGYIATRLGRHAVAGSSILDFGCERGIMTCAASQLGASVLAIDLQTHPFSFRHPSVEFRILDVMSLDIREAFDLIVNCSTIEHVGLSGRYDSHDYRDGDIEAMKRLRQALKPQGVMLLTLPVGLDAIFAPVHRIYGAERLQKLLEGYKVEEDLYWVKNMENEWIPCSKDCALFEKGSTHYYALGCMTLTRGIR